MATAPDAVRAGGANDWVPAREGMMLRETDCYSHRSAMDAWHAAEV